MGVNCSHKDWKHRHSDVLLGNGNDKQRQSWNDLRAIRHIFKHMTISYIIFRCKTCMLWNFGHWSILLYYITVFGCCELFFFHGLYIAVSNYYNVMNHIWWIINVSLYRISPCHCQYAANKNNWNRNMIIYPKLCLLMTLNRIGLRRPCPWIDRDLSEDSDTHFHKR